MVPTDAQVQQAEYSGLIWGLSFGLISVRAQLVQAGFIMLTT